MKRLSSVILALLLLAPSFAFAQTGGASQIRHGTLAQRPAACRTDRAEVYYQTDDAGEGKGFYDCPANAWRKMTAGTAALQALLDAKESAANRNAADGYAGLDASGLLPDNRLPASIARDSEVAAAVSALSTVYHPLLGYTPLDTASTTYALLAGRAGGQTLNGGSGAGDNLTLTSNSKILFGTRGAYDLANGRLGVGTQSPTRPFHVSYSSTGAGPFATAIVVSTTPAAQDDNQWNGLESLVLLNGPQNFIRGGGVSADLSSGIRGYGGFTSSGTGAFLGGVTARVDVAGGGTLTNAALFTGEKIELSGNSTVTNVYGVYPFKGAVSATAGSTIVNTYGVYVPTLAVVGGGSQTNTPFAFYNAGANDLNYFAGRTGVNRAAPAGQLHVVAKDANTFGLLVDMAASPSATLGTPFQVRDSTGAAVAELTSANSLNLYNATGANYVRGYARYAGSRFELGSEKGGSGTAGTLQLVSTAGDIRFGTVSGQAGVLELTLNSSTSSAVTQSRFAGTAMNQTAGAATGMRFQTTWNPTSGNGSFVVADFTPSLNATGTVSGASWTAVRVSPFLQSTTGVASPLLLDLGTNSAASGGGTHTSRFSVDSAGNVTAATEYRVGGTKVVGSRCAALPADATDLASAITLLNAVKACLVSHGLAAP